MKNLAAFVLAGGHVKEMGVLTHRRAKAAVPIAGTYRIIDFAMSNLSLSGVNRVGVLSQYRPSSLMDHVGVGEPWGLVGRNREVKILSPYQAENVVDWYMGTADAVYQNLSFMADADRVMVLSGDHVYHMDYGPVLEAHAASNADLTMVFKRFDRASLSRYGNARVDGDRRVLEYVEKPRTPLSDLGSLTIYLFNRDILEDYLRRFAPPRGEQYQLYETIIPEIIRRGRVRAFVFDGYWAYARTVDDYHAASMDLLDPESGFDLNGWDVRTNTEDVGMGDVPPALLGPRAEVENSWVAPGAVVHGHVRNSILSPRVVVEEGAELDGCVLFNSVHVERGARLTRVVSDKHSRFHADCRVGSAGDAVPNEVAGAYHRSGITVVGREVHVGPGAVVGANCQLYPDSRIEDGAQVPDGRYFATKEGLK